MLCRETNLNALEYKYLHTEQENIMENKTIWTVLEYLIPKTDSTPIIIPRKHKICELTLESGEKILIWGAGHTSDGEIYLIWSLAEEADTSEYYRIDIFGENNDRSVTLPKSETRANIESVLYELLAEDENIITVWDYTKIRDELSDN